MLNCWIKKQLKLKQCLSRSFTSTLTPQWYLQFQVLLAGLPQIATVCCHDNHCLDHRRKPRWCGHMMWCIQRSPTGSESRLVVNLLLTCMIRSVQRLCNTCLEYNLEIFEAALEPTTQKLIVFVGTHLPLVICLARTQLTLLCKLHLPRVPWFNVLHFIHFN